MAQALPTTVFDAGTDRFVVVLTTGGTIACTHVNGALEPTVSGVDLLAPLVERFTGAEVGVKVQDLTRLDSSAISFADLDHLRAAIDTALADPTTVGVVVTHGTDSLEETAIAIDTFHADSRPVVFTGAQKSFDHPEADGPGNLFEAIIVAADSSAVGIGALIVFGHAVLPARGALKWHTSDELAFGTNGPEEPTRPTIPPAVPLAGTKVEIIPAYAGCGRTLLDAAIAAGAQGLVIEAMGSGNVSPELGQGISAALAAGIPVVITTRVPRGEVTAAYGGAGGGATLASQGAIGSTYFRAAQARVLLAIAITSGVHPATLF